MHLSKFAGKLGFTGNLSRKDAKSLAVKENFPQELIELLTDLNYRDSFASLAEFNAEGIWNNSLRLESHARLSFIRNGFNAGVQNIDDVLTIDSKFLEYSCFTKEFCPNVSFLEYYGVRLRHLMRS